MIKLYRTLIPIITVASALVLLNGCNSSSSSVIALSIIAASGNNVTLSGSYETPCYGGGSLYYIDTSVFTGNEWSYTSVTYSDTVCMNETSTGNIVGTLVAGTNFAAAGWKDGGGIMTTAPNEDTGGGTLDANPMVTPLAFTATADSTGDFAGITTGDTEALFYVVDDSGSADILYRDNDYTSGSDDFASTADPLTALP